MALLQCGPNLMPSGAPEHARDFPDRQTRAVKCLEELLEWLSSFADAFTDHRSKDEMQEASQRSGTQRGQSGLTPEQHERRAWRNKMLRRLQDAQRIQAAVRRNPRSWYELELWEKDALDALESGKLQQDFEAAKKAHGGRVQAPPFRM